MTFTIIGPGIRDAIPTTKLLRTENIKETHQIEPKNAIDDSDPDQSNQPNTRWPTTATQAYKETNEFFRQKLTVTAAEIMSHPVITLVPENTIDDALEVIQDNGFRHIPIVSPDTAQLLGMISERDLLRHLAQSHTTEDESPAPLTTSLDEIMSKRVLTASADTSIHELARLFVAQRIGAIPIIEEDTCVKGMITHSDVLRTLIEHNSLELWA